MSPAKKAPMSKKAAPAKKKAIAKKKAAPTKKKAAPTKKKAPAKKTTAPVKETTTTPSPTAHEATDPFAGDWSEDLWGEGWEDLADEDTWPSDDTPTEDRSGAQHRAAESVEVFQNAARDLIEAARNALDIAEELVADPHAIGTAFDSLRSIAVEVARSASPMTQRRGGDRNDDDGEDFQFIRVDGD